MAIYLVIITYLYFYQEKLIFFYDTLPKGYKYKFDREFKEMNFETPLDGNINALVFTVENPKGLVFYSHGNKGTLKDWGMVYPEFCDRGYDFLVYDYRKYGKSTGKLTQAAILSDANFIYEKMAEKYGEENIIIYGRSLGTGISCYIASKNNPSKLFLETPYHSLSSLGSSRYPFIPVRSLSKFPMPSFEYMVNVTCPVYIIHGTRDYVIPLRSASELYEEAGGEARMVVIEGGGHNNLNEFDQYHKLLDTALK